MVGRSKAQLAYGMAVASMVWHDVCREEGPDGPPRWGAGSMRGVAGGPSTDAPRVWLLVSSGKDCASALQPARR